MLNQAIDILILLFGGAVIVCMFIHIFREAYNLISDIKKKITQPQKLFLLYAKGVNAPAFHIFEPDYLIGIFSTRNLAEDSKRECIKERKDRDFVIKEVLYL